MSWVKNWIRRRTFGDWAFATVALFALTLRGPILIEQFQKQGTVIQSVAIEGKLIPPPGEKSVLVFWATWCGPCTVELKRINSAVEKGELSKKNLFAVNMGEEKQIVEKAMKERNYLFPVLQDPGGELAGKLGVSATPTIAFIHSDGTIKWLSSGLSPTLIYRIKAFQRD